jgi:cobalamin biosynthetic protein CobC
MLIRPQIAAPLPSLSLKPLAHGGDLAAARQMFAGAPEPFIDLSTGINPHPYPVPALAAEVFARLPDRAGVRRLTAVAARVYGAPSADHVLAAPGTQMLLPQVSLLAATGRAAVLQTSYVEHCRAAALAGHAVSEVSAVDELVDATLAVVVNPNNPNGRIVPRDALVQVADRLRPRGGLLLVDEAFGDVAAAGNTLAGDVGRGNIVVLRSFGKFFGLAGLRLGFAIAAPSFVERLEAMLGPWAVSGAAVAVGEKALADNEWRERTLARLETDATRLDDELLRAGLKIVGGTSLFRLTSSPESEQMFLRLGHAGILVRRFRDQPALLRWGLPGSENAWRRLRDALSSGP